MKIGILTLFHGNYNWGGVLQGYALKTLIETEFPNCQADLLIYKGNNIVYDNKLKQILQYSPIEIAQKIKTRITSKCNKQYKIKLQQRYKLFRQFMEEFTTNPYVYNDESLVDASKEYDCLISGSDQVWNPNVGLAGFFQSNIGCECKKISYAASIARDDLSVYERKKIISLIEKFNAVSVREKTAKEIIEKYSESNINVTEVLDPVMMIPKDKWEQVSEKSKQDFKGKYAIAFFFSKSYKYRKKILSYCQDNNLSLVFIPFAKGEYIKSDNMGDAKRAFDLGPYEFLNLFRNAECVFTDSFHGSVFSIIFQKPFCVFRRDKKGKVSKNSRLYDLIEKFQLSDRMIDDVSKLDETIKKPIDFNSVNSLLNKFQSESLSFLKNALKDCSEKNIKELKNIKCNGCSLCVLNCPQKCIEMHKNVEGFYYPEVNEDLCIGCGQCFDNCSADIKTKAVHLNKAFVGFNTIEKTREESSSGGLFSAIAEQILKNDGLVYGAAYTQDYNVKHIRIANKEGLQQLRASKYVQSDISDTFIQVLEDLKNGHQVLFAGTPCQVAAMQHFISKNKMDEKLLLVDFICHGVPSPGVWESYLKYLENTKKSKVKCINFREKSKGWHDYCFKVIFENAIFKETHELNAYMRSFLTDKNIRKSCYHCSFKKDNYFSDITLGDAWKIEKDYPEWADDKGTSFFVIRTKKGETVFSQINDIFQSRETDYLKWQKYNPSIACSTVLPIGRKGFFSEYVNMNEMDFWNKQKKIPIKKRIKYSAKRFVKFIGLEKKLRKKF